MEKHLKVESRWLTLGGARVEKLYRLGALSSTGTHEGRSENP